MSWDALSSDVFPSSEAEIIVLKELGIFPPSLPFIGYVSFVPSPVFCLLARGFYTNSFVVKNVRVNTPPSFALLSSPERLKLQCKCRGPRF